MLIPTDLLKAALYCASNEESRYYLRGVHLATSGHMVTTDGHRLFCAKLAEAVSADVIIPLDTVKAALKLAGKRAETIELNGNTLGGIVFQPVDGTFPDWRRVIPAATGFEFKPDPDTKPAHFNPDYIYDLGQMSRALGSKTGTAFQIHAWGPENPHGVTFCDRTDCFAVIMPMRQQSEITPWHVARAIA
jgi:DNA polymerase III sliding clamp (beta) subunit (PCNA family)